MPLIYQEVELEVELDDFDTDDLIEELERRGSGIVAHGSGKELITSIYEKRRNSKDYQRELDDLIYLAIGRIQ